jgi:hypothetical protein
MQVGGEVIGDQANGLSGVYASRDRHQVFGWQAHVLRIATTDAKRPGRASHDLPWFKRFHALADRVDNADDILTQREGDVGCSRQTARTALHEVEGRNTCGEDLHAGLALGG